MCLMTFCQCIVRRKKWRCNVIYIYVAPIEVSSDALWVHKECSWVVLNRQESTELLPNGSRLRPNSLRKESPDNFFSLMQRSSICRSRALTLLLSEFTIRKQCFLTRIGLRRVDLQKIAPSKEESSQDQRRQSGLKYGGRGSGSTKFRFFQANFREISLSLANFTRNFDFSGQIFRKFARKF